MPKFRTRFNVDEFEKPVLVCETPSLAQQQFKDECDVNFIVDRFTTTGILNHVDERTPLYADVSNVPSDYMQALAIVSQANENFDSLDSNIRKFFDNNPANMLEFIQNPANKDKAIELGLIPKPVEVTSQEA